MCNISLSLIGLLGPTTTNSFSNESDSMWPSRLGLLMHLFPSLRRPELFVCGYVIFFELYLHHDGGFHHLWATLSLIWMELFLKMMDRLVLVLSFGNIMVKRNQDIFALGGPSKLVIKKLLYGNIHMMLY